MKIKALTIFLAILLILPEVTRAVCDGYDQTYRYKSATFYVSNARKIKVSVYNSMQDRYPRCYTAWIKINGNYINLDGLPYSPENWQQAWASTAPDCFDSGYRVVSGYSSEAEYDLTKYAPNGYTGVVEVRVSSDCYEVAQVDPCFCWTAKVEVIEYAQPTQYCYLDIYVKDQYGNPLSANIYVDSNYLAYASHVEKQVLVGTHTVFANKPGYSSDSKTVSCSCGETKRVDLVLSSIQVCTPGEIRNRYCACSTQVVYEKCKADGSGWETVVENCPPGYVCKDGYCTLEKDGWYDTGRERCNLAGLECGTGIKEKEQEYRDYTCIGVTCTYVVRERRWVSIGTCYQGCASGYTCQAGYCVKVTTTTLPACTPGYLDEFRCFGNWVQRKYLYSDCSTGWINWEYCSYGCSNGSCLPEKPCSISLSVTTPSNVLVGDIVTTTLKITNYGDLGGYVSFDAYVCKEDPYCIPMDCEIDPTVYVPAHDTITLTCTARVQETGSYRIKVSYSGCDKSGTIYSGIFSVKEKEKKCFAEFLNEFKCSGNWKLQLYRYSDCSTAWVYVEYCSFGCSNGSCLPKPETTTTTLPCAEEKEIAPTGQFELPEVAWIALIILIAFLLALLILWFLSYMKFKRRRRKPEWFGKDC